MTNRPINQDELCEISNFIQVNFNKLSLSCSTKKQNHNTVSALPTKLAYLVLSFHFLIGNHLVAQVDTKAIIPRIVNEADINKAEPFTQIVFNHEKFSQAEPQPKEKKKQHEDSNAKNTTLLEEANQRYRVLRFLWINTIILFLITIAYILRKKEKQQNTWRKTFANEGKIELIQRIRDEHNALILKNTLKDKVDESTIDKVIKDLQLSSNNTFDEDFLLVYHKVDNEFFPRLRKKHASLTKHEQVLCGMIRMGLDSKQIAHITFRTPESIHVARCRLRKRLEIKPKEDLNRHLQRI